MARILLLSLLLAPAGCSSDWMQARDRQERAFATVPTNPRGDIVAFMRTYLNNPVGVRDAYISEPAQRNLDGLPRYTVCIRYNPRDSTGQYQGSRDNLVLFRDGRLERVIDARLDRGAGPDPAREQCKDAVYQRFPELERMSR